jgi:teichoic acid transport system ATP-binding protein
MQARLGFGLAVNLDPDVLLVDEVFAVGDEQFRSKCIRRMEQLRSRGRTIMFVSHQLETIKRFCDRVCLLDSGLLKFIGGAASGVTTYHRLLAGQVESDGS